MRRNDCACLKQQLEALEAKKSARVSEHMSQMGNIEVKGTDLFCYECELLYTLSLPEQNKCNLEGCYEHKQCPKCARKQLEHRAQRTVRGVEYWVVKGGDEIREGDIEIQEEQTDWPHDSGYVDCWFCKATYCNRDFKDHYQECREKASCLCGLRAPKGNNVSKDIRVAWPLWEEGRPAQGRLLLSRRCTLRHSLLLRLQKCLH